MAFSMNLNINLGKKLIDVLDSEFHSFPKEYYIKAIEEDMEGV